ncbi:MAG: hypothetical protein R3185_07720 [Candidatus Thermoplasmatota archaeon]|nr:hypothetical protein [Candidatus Thermoplasmatota archaeon]
MRGLGTSVACLLLLSAFVPGVVGEDHRDPFAPCMSPSTTVAMEKLVLTYPDEEVHGCIASPADDATSVETLVVFAHGLGWSVQAGWLGHMAEVVDRAPGTAVVATNYRDNFGFPVLAGAEDTVRATQIALDRFPDVERTILLGVSMGGAVSGTAIHIAPSMNDGEGLYDTWFDLEGVSNLFETYTEARAVGLGIPFAADVADAIERDAGGTPAEAPSAYHLRSPALNAQAMADAGLQEVVVVHGVNDGLVPYNQGHEMAKAAAAAGLPVEVHTITRTEEGQTAGTTPTGHALSPEDDPNEQYLHLAGHASEGDRGHPVMDVGLERLISLLDGEAVQTGYTGAVHDTAASASFGAGA